MDGFALEKIRQEWATVEDFLVSDNLSRIWAGGDSDWGFCLSCHGWLCTWQNPPGTGLCGGMFSLIKWWLIVMFVGWLGCCLFLRLPISISRVNATTFVIMGLAVNAKKGAKEIPWPVPRDMKVLLKRIKGQSVLCKLWAVTAVIFARCWQSSWYQCWGTSMMLLLLAMAVNSRHTLTVSHSHSGWQKATTRTL